MSLQGRPAKIVHYPGWPERAAPAHLQTKTSRPQNGTGGKFPAVPPTLTVPAV